MGSGLDNCSGDDRPEWDHRLARKLDGATVLVGMTYHESSGDRVEQFFGTVVSVSEDDGISLRLEGSRSGEMFHLPPDLRSFEPARPGTYRLRATGETVHNPDYVAVWELASAPH